MTGDECLPALTGVGDPSGALAAARAMALSADDAGRTAADVAWESQAAWLFREAITAARAALSRDLDALDEALRLAGAYLVAVDDARRAAIARVAGGVG